MAKADGEIGNNFKAGLQAILNYVPVRICCIHLQRTTLHLKTQMLQIYDILEYLPTPFEITFTKSHDLVILRALARAPPCLISVY